MYFKNDLEQNFVKTISLLEILEIEEGIIPSKHSNTVLE